jgi:hypothetical protein
VEEPGRAVSATKRRFEIAIRTRYGGTDRETVSIKKRLGGVRTYMLEWVTRGSQSARPEWIVEYAQTVVGRPISTDKYEFLLESTHFLVVAMR